MISKLFGMILARLTSPLVSFLIIVLVARKWGGELLGQYNTVWVWLVIFQYISLLGITEYITRELGSDKTKTAKYLTHGLLLVMFSSLICTAAMTSGALFLNYPDKVKYCIIAASLALPFTACIMVCQAVFNAYQKIRYIAAASIAENALFLISGSVVILKGYGLLSLIWSLVLVRVFASALNLTVTVKYIVPLDFQIDWGFFRRMLPPVIVFGLTGVAFHIFMRADIIMISKMKDMSTVGLYTSASKLIEICTMLPLTFYFLNLPVAADAYKNFRESAHRKLENLAEKFFILVFFIFGFGIIFAEMILAIIYGKPFAESATVLRVLLIAFLIHSVEITLEMSCQSAGYQKVAMYIAVFRAAANIALNLVLIPVWGALGASLATLGSISFSFMAFRYFMKRKLGDFKWSRMIGKPALICLSTILVFLPLVNCLNAVLLVLIFFACYTFMVLAFNGFSLTRMRLREP